MGIKDKFEVRTVKPFECKDWLLGKHYAKRMPSISYSYGLYDVTKTLVGVCTFGTPASSTLLRGVCGDEYAGQVKELNRLVVATEERNVLSFFLGGCFDLLPTPLILVSYADSSQGHHGYIYQATNWLYTGLSAKFSDPQVKGLEHQHHATYAHGMNKAELQSKFGDKLYYKDRARKHRYIYFLGNKRERRLMRQALKYPIEPYPKGDNERYDASYEPQVQSLLFGGI